ncbi:MAG TPA: hypothetical protein VGK67_11825 [Myxococcales bacterium]|jgi:hypothetical protein
MIRPALALAAALAVLPACGAASLSDFSSSQLTLDQQADGRIVVELSGSRGSCSTLNAEVRATLNGRAMSVDFAGGEVASHQGWTCRAPQFSLSAAEAAGLTETDAVVVIEDGSATLELESENFFAPRLLVADRYEEDEKAGRKVMTFRWVPETDANRTASWRLQGKSGNAQFGEARVDSDLVSIVLPPQAAERATLRMEGRAEAPVVRCQGVAGCAATVRTSTGDLSI